MLYWKLRTRVRNISHRLAHLGHRPPLPPKPAWSATAVPVTIKDIAEAANVSHTTVSRALKGHGRISDATVQRIRQLADEMGYTPSAVAQSLVTQRTRPIGVVVTTIADPFVVNVVSGIEEAAQAAGYSVFLSSSHNDSERELAVVGTFHRRRVDAVIVSASRVGNFYAAHLQRFQVPIVLINSQAESDTLHSVASDDVQGATLAVNHLLQQGHRRIAYIGSAARPHSSLRRRDGYQQALAAAGTVPDPRWAVAPEAPGDLEAGQRGLAGVLAVEPTAVFTYNDMTAVGVLLEARRRGIAVPQQLSVVGFDDIELTRFLHPPLTTVNQPKQAMGRAAVHMALALLNGQEAHNQLLPCSLVVRDSTARPLPVAALRVAR
jgi:LacI family transcriptional regulator/LacI family repressor for deo operon, udp, cdd, tsx, nupC, and nupG